MHFSSPAFRSMDLSTAYPTLLADLPAVVSMMVVGLMGLVLIVIDAFRNDHPAIPWLGAAALAVSAGWEATQLGAPAGTVLFETLRTGGFVAYINLIVLLAGLATTLVSIPYLNQPAAPRPRRGLRSSPVRHGRDAHAGGLQQHGEHLSGAGNDVGLSLHPYGAGARGRGGGGERAQVLPPGRLFHGLLPLRHCPDVRGDRHDGAAGDGDGGAGDGVCAAALLGRVRAVSGGLLL
jgi:hypothetical protein